MFMHKNVTITIIKCSDLRGSKGGMGEFEHRKGRGRRNVCGVSSIHKNYRKVIDI